MTLDDLSDRWNKLRAAALGRGVVPRVSAPLARRVADAHERFRAWASNPMFFASPYQLEATEIYNSTLAAVQRELGAAGLPAPAQGPLASLEAAAQSAASVGQQLLWAAAALGLVLLWKRR